MFDQAFAENCLVFNAAAVRAAPRNTKDFENIDGLMLANPWQAPIPQ